MLIDACQNCGKSFETRLAPCPDGIEGCLVCHYDENSYVCPHCGHDNRKMVTDLSGGVREHIGVGNFNPDGLRRLNIYRE